MTTNFTWSINEYLDPNDTLLDNQIHISAHDFHNYLETLVTGFFLIIHLNIPSNEKNLENFKSFLRSLDFILNIIYFSETWRNDLDNFTYDLPNYISFNLKKD